MLDKNLTALRGLVADNPKELERFEVSRRFGRAKMAELKKTIDLHQAGHRDQAIALVKTDRARRRWTRSAPRSRT